MLIDRLLRGRAVGWGCDRRDSSPLRTTLPCQFRLNTMNCSFPTLLTVMLTVTIVLPSCSASSANFLHTSSPSSTWKQIYISFFI